MRIGFRNRLNSAVAEGVQRLVWLLPSSRASRSAAHVLLYHSIGESDEPTGDYSLRISPGQFREQMAYLRAHCRVVSVRDLLENGVEETTSERATVAITFDDGYRDNLLDAAPILDEFGLPATFFVATDFIEGKALATYDALTPQELRQLHDAGFEIGSHLQAHRPISTLSLDEARQQLVQSKRILEDIISSPVRYFSFPFGGYKDATAQYRALTVEAGYDAAFSALYGGIRRGTRDFGFLPRVPVNKSDQVRHFELKTQGRYDALRTLQVIRDALFYHPQDSLTG